MAQRMDATLYQKPSFRSLQFQVEEYSQEVLSVWAAYDLYNACKFIQCQLLILKSVQRIQQKPISNKTSLLSLLKTLQAKVYASRERSKKTMIELLMSSKQLAPSNVESTQTLVTVQSELSAVARIKNILLGQKNYPEQWTAVNAYVKLFEDTKEQALADVESILKRINSQPNYYYSIYRCYFFLAKIRQACFRYEESIELFEKDLEFDREHFFTLRHLVRTSFMLRDYKRAETYAKLKERQQCLTFEDLTIMAACAILQGQQAKARSILREITDEIKGEEEAVYYKPRVCYMGILCHFQMYDEVKRLRDKILLTKLQEANEEVQLAIVTLQMYRRTNEPDTGRQILEELALCEDLSANNLLELLRQLTYLAQYSFAMGSLSSGRKFVEAFYYFVDFCSNFDQDLLDTMVRRFHNRHRDEAILFAILS